MSVDLIKQLRDETGSGIMEIKKALDEGAGDLTKARAILKKSGAAKAAKRAERTAGQGMVEAYSHNGRIGVLVEVNCETDFVARGDGFKEFAHDVVLQVAAMKPENVDDLLKQEYVKDTGKTVGDLLEALIAKTGEKIVISRFVTYELGKE